MDNRKNGLLTKLNPISMIVIGFCIVTIVVIIISIVWPSQNEYGPGTKIDNIGTYIDDMPQDTKDSIFAALYKMIDMNLPQQETPPRSGALIRQGTVNKKYDSGTDISSGSFVVDIKEKQQSYKVQYEWSNTMPNPDLSGVTVLVSCLPEELSIYSDFAHSCIESINNGNTTADDNTDVWNLYSNLPYFSETDSGVAYNVQQRYYSGGDMYLELNVNSCGDTSIEKEVKVEVEQWLERILVEPDKYEIRLRRLCDGSF